MKQLTENEETMPNFLQMLQEKESEVKRNKKFPSVTLKQKEPFRNVLDILWFSVATKISS